MFQLTWEEAEVNLNPRSQIVTLESGKNVKYRPFAFTEQGIAMLSSVLRSKRADPTRPVFRYQLHVNDARQFAISRGKVYVRTSAGGAILQ